MLGGSFDFPVIRSLVLPLALSFAFLVCSVVPPFAQFFLLFMGIFMLSCYEQLN